MVDTRGGHYSWLILADDGTDDGSGWRVASFCPFLFSPLVTTRPMHLRLRCKTAIVFVTHRTQSPSRSNSWTVIPKSCTSTWSPSRQDNEKKKQERERERGEKQQQQEEDVLLFCLPFPSCFDFGALCFGLFGANPEASKSLSNVA